MSHPPPTPHEHSVLTSLTAAVSLLSRIDTVLDEILVLTDREEEGSVFARQEGVTRSLKRWEKMGEWGRGGGRGFLGG